LFGPRRWFIVDRHAQLTAIGDVAIVGRDREAAVMACEQGCRKERHDDERLSHETPPLSPIDDGAHQKLGRRHSPSPAASRHPLQRVRDSDRASLLPSGEGGYDRVITRSTRRFCCRPATVLFVSFGW